MNKLKLYRMFKDLDNAYSNFYTKQTVLLYPQLTPTYVLGRHHSITNYLSETNEHGATKREAEAITSADKLGQLGAYLVSSDEKIRELALLKHKILELESTLESME